MPVRSDPKLHALERPSRRGRTLRRRLGLIALDSEGCVFDSTARKYEACFLPAFSAVFGEGLPPSLQREVWALAAQGPRLSGASRFRALAAALRLLCRHPEASPRRSLWPRSAEALEAWLSLETAPSSLRLEEAVAGISFGRMRRGGGGALGRALLPVLAWQRALEARVASLPPPRPFPGVRAALQLLSRKAELFILASAPESELRSDWGRARLNRRIAAFLGEESGEPRLSLPAYAAQAAAEGRISREQLLVVSAFPWALEAARSSGAAFFPIIPGREEECWSLLSGEGFERFLAGETAPASALLPDFLAFYSRRPPWRTRCS